MKSLTSRSLFGFGLLLSILFLTGTIFAAATNTLNVKCVDDSGKALVGAKVQIMAFGTGGKFKDAKADATGIAHYEKLEDGAYRVVVRPEGLAPGLYEPVFLKNSAQENITVKCPVGDPLKKFYWEDDALNAKAFELLKQAVGLLNEQKYAEAEKLFRDSLDMSPSNPDALFYYAVNLAQEKKWDLAKESFQKSYDMATALVMGTPPPPKDPKGTPPAPSPFATVQNNAKTMLTMLPGLKLKVEGNDELTQKNYKLAITKFEEAVKLIPTDPDAFYGLALSLGYDKQWDAAGKAADKAIALRPEDKGYLDLKKRLGDNAVLEKAKAVADQGDTMYNSKDYAGALKKYEEALPLLPDPALQASVWVQIGRSRTQLKQADAAVEAYNRAIQLAPPQDAPKYKQALADHYKIVAEQYLNDKQYDQAFAAYAQAGIPIFKLGQDWAKKPETEDLAIMAFQQVIKTEPLIPEAYFELGSLYYFNKKDYAKAKEYLTKYLQAGKDDKTLENARNILQVIEKKKQVNRRHQISTLRAQRKDSFLRPLRLDSMLLATGLARCLRIGTAPVIDAVSHPAHRVDKY
ncbi:MAG: tetratricopeptide repeat protein [Acidobacteriia bacterium]|nr:tetratricopeptide repeat protein [Terriglobia bacterium]